MATLSYDALDHFTQWNAGSNNFEQYVYDASGNRVLRRSTNGSGTTMTVYAFGLEDHSYSSSGSNTGNTYYYSLVGRLIGKWDGTNTTFYLVDALGTPQASFSNVANSAALKGNQVYGPYGKQNYHQGTIGTPRGFTGQYNDSLTGLDYYNARYYDPVAGVFLSVDTVQGNGSGDNPYAYVNGNPETYSDPTGQFLEPTRPAGGLSTLDPSIDTGSSSGDSSNTGDSDLVDVTISYSTPAQHGKGAIQKSEVLHTTSEHPFMTTEHGFMPDSRLGRKHTM